MKPSLKVQSVRKKDRTTDLVSKGFTFTRKVTSAGPYFKTADKIWSLRNTSISTLINEIEGQSADSSGNLVKWPKYFNFLVGPLNADMVMCKANNDSSGAITPKLIKKIIIFKHLLNKKSNLCICIPVTLPGFP